MNNEIESKDGEQLKKLLEKNLEISEKIYKTTKYIKSYVIWSQILGFIKIILIVVPIILGIIYLPPLLKGVIGQYQDLLGIGGNDNSNAENLLKGGAGGLDLNKIDVNKLPSQLKDLLKK